MTDKIKKILANPKPTSADMEVLRNYEPGDGTNALYSFFTPVWLCKVMYDLAIRHGFNEATGKILEPAAGTGNFLEVIKHPENVTAFELDSLNAEIAKKRVPKTRAIITTYFETAFLAPPRHTSPWKGKKGTKNEYSWLKHAPFDLVIGNPPYGKYKNLYSSYFKKPRFKQVEMFFMYKSLQLLKPGGLLVFITASNFLRNESTYLNEKTSICQYGELIDAYRMPKVFSHTQVPTDIIIFKKK